MCALLYHLSSECDAKRLPVSTETAGARHAGKLVARSTDGCPSKTQRPVPGYWPRWQYCRVSKPVPESLVYGRFLFGSWIAVLIPCGIYVLLSEFSDAAVQDQNQFHVLLYLLLV